MFQNNAYIIINYNKFYDVLQNCLETLLILNFKMFRLEFCGYWNLKNPNGEHKIHNRIFLDCGKIENYVLHIIVNYYRRFMQKPNEIDNKKK